MGKVAAVHTHKIRACKALDCFSWTVCFRIRKGTLIAPLIF